MRTATAHSVVLLWVLGVVADMLLGDRRFIAWGTHHLEGMHGKA
jgi:hypothetical protein